MLVYATVLTVSYLLTKLPGRSTKINNKNCRAALYVETDLHQKQYQSRETRANFLTYADKSKLRRTAPYAENARIYF